MADVANGGNAPDLIQRKASCSCGGGCPACQSRAGDLKLSQPNDPTEIEADRVAERVMQMPVGEAATITRERNTSDTLHLKAYPGSKSAQPSSGIFGSSGRELDGETRRFFEPRFGRDLGNVRVHTGDAAIRSAEKYEAKAFTLGDHIGFAGGAYDPGSSTGKYLLAHELAHVAQQEEDGVVRRCVNPSVNDPKYDALANTIRKHAKFTALKDKSEADEVLVEAKKKPSCLDMLGKFQVLLDTPEKSEAEITTETQASTAAAVTAETKRVATAAPKDLNVEESASKAVPAGAWKKIKGKFGGGSYEVDNRDPKNIVIRAKIFLKATGTGTVVDVDSVKKMEDGIEKAASVKGFLVDLDFVNAPGGDAFEIEVNPGEWEVATNWSGGDPLGFAHELFHLMFYEIDRYDYFDQATNRSMKIPNRIHWFLIQLKKPSGWDNPASIAASGPHPLDDDICRVAGLPEADCIKKRKAP